MAQLPPDPASYGDVSNPVRLDPWHTITGVHWKKKDKPPPINPDGGICLHQFGAFYLIGSTRLVIDTTKNPVADSSQGIYSIWYRQITHNPGIPQGRYDSFFGRLTLMHAERTEPGVGFGGWLQEGGTAVSPEDGGTAHGGFHLVAVNGNELLGTVLTSDFSAAEIDEDDGSWHHIICSWSVPDVMQCYVDGVDRSGTSFPGDGSTIQYSQGRSAFPSLDGVGILFPAGSPEVAILGSDWAEGTSGMFAELYFAPGQFVDLSADIARFRTPTGKPADLGDDGSLPTGVVPLVYGCDSTPVYLRGRNLATAPSIISTADRGTTITIGDFFSGHFPPPLDPWS